MSKRALSVILFVCGFLVTYAFLCFALSGGMKWVPEATPTQIMIGNICYMPIFKSIVSLIVGLIAGTLPARMERKK